MIIKSIQLSVDADGWISLDTQLGSKIVIHAQSIRKNNKRPMGRHGNHRVDEAKAEGGPEIKPISWDITKFV